MLTILQGDCLEVLKTLPAESVHCCITSPPYWGLRDYGVAGQIGLEPSIDEFLQKLVAVFREVRRVLRPDGTCWINMGDSYASGGGSGIQGTRGQRFGRRHTQETIDLGAKRYDLERGIKPKDLVGQPWMLAFALRADGWYLRQDIIWHKPNPMPESISDRCTKAHEYIFLLSKSARYYYDQAAIREKVSPNTHSRLSQNLEAQIGSERANGGAKTNGNMKAVTRKRRPSGWAQSDAGEKIGRYPRVKDNESFDSAMCLRVDDRNKRSVWTVNTFGFSEAHFATYPPDLIKPCVLAGCPAGGVVLDPFGGSGTTGQVALELGRSAILIELNADYIPLIHKRTNVTRGLGL